MSILKHVKAVKPKKDPWKAHANFVSRALLYDLTIDTAFLNQWMESITNNRSAAIELVYLQLDLSLIKRSALGLCPAQHSISSCP